MMNIGRPYTLLYHVYEDETHEDEKLIRVFPSEEKVRGLA